MFIMNSTRASCTEIDFKNKILEIKQEAKKKKMKKRLVYFFDIHGENLAIERGALIKIEERVNAK